MDAAVTGLRDAAQATPESAVAARAANAVSAPMPDLFALYSPTTPTDVLALDYLGREVVLDAMDANSAAAVADVQTIALTWKALRPAVENAGGDQEAADFAASVTRLQDLASGSDMAALIEQANVNLELVDVLEGVF